MNNMCLRPLGSMHHISTLQYGMSALRTRYARPATPSRLHTPDTLVELLHLGLIPHNPISQSVYPVFMHWICSPNYSISVSGAGVLMQAQPSQSHPPHLISQLAHSVFKHWIPAPSYPIPVSGAGKLSRFIRLGQYLVFTHAQGSILASGPAYRRSAYPSRSH